MAAVSQIQAISGLGGIGKTQTAVEYAYRHRTEYRAVFWVRSETEVELSAGFVDMARLLDLPQKDAQDPADTIRGVKDWLETHSGWLLIFDNADQPDLLLPFRPRQGQGHTLLTSRAQVFDRFGITRPISLRKMPADEAVAFLLKRSGQETDDPIEKDAAAMLVKELDYLPLALEQAGAFILRRQLKFSTYLSQYRKQRLKLLDRQLPTVGNEQQPNRSVRTTWQLNFQVVQEINPASAELLRFSAFVAPDDIPYELLIRSRGLLGQILDDALQTEDENEAKFIIADLLEPLTQYSLVRLESGKESYTIHRLVQEVVKAELEQERLQQLIGCVIAAVTQAFPTGVYENWSVCEQLIPQAKAVAQLIQYAGVESKTAALLLNEVGYYLDQRGQYSEAEPLYEEALSMYKRLLGDEHPYVATTLNNLALLYDNQGRYSEAEPLYEEALAMRKRLLGDEHPDVALSLNNLASLYYSQGRYSEAELLYQEALTMRKRLLGDEHPDVALGIRNLAFIY
ncbi:MAG: tetratricopeptide repeat protein, partial [Leptolyngbya sp. SIO3F4]|nr:tetratricopeptide repeat protein [Leptolyngbya sp. SIO3F4]